MILNDGLNDGFTVREVLEHSSDPYCLEVCCGDSPMFFSSASESAIAERFYKLDMILFDKYSDRQERDNAYKYCAKILKKRLGIL